MIGLYRACPFAGIVCIECKARISERRKNEGLVYALTLHEQQCHRGSPPLTIVEKKSVVALCLAELERIAVAMTQCHNKDEATSIVKQYLSSETMFPFCEACNVCIASKQNHKKEHYKRCVSKRHGYGVTNWVKKSPKIVPYPLDIELESNFSPLFWRLLVQAKIFHATTDRRLVQTTETEVPTNENDNNMQCRSFIDDRCKSIRAKILSETSALVILDRSQHVEPNLWLKRVGWSTHLNGLPHQQILALASPASEHEEYLKKVDAALTCAVLTAQETIVQQIDTSNAVLFELERKVDGITNSKPFVANIKRETMIKYCSFLQKIFRVILRMNLMEIECRPPYKSSIERDEVVARIQRYSGRCNLDSINEAALQDECINLFFLLLGEPLKLSSYDSILISAMAVCGLNGDGSFATAAETTQNYSALIKISKTLILYTSIADCRSNRHGDDLIGLVRTKMTRFMIHANTDLDNAPKPMSWVYHMLNYGRKIVSQTIGPARIVWINETIHYQNIQFSMEQLRFLVRSVTVDLQSDLQTLLLSESGHDEDVVPRFEWERVVDRHDVTTVGYSFLKEDSNTWLLTGSSFLIGKLKSSRYLQEEWFQQTDDLFSLRANATTRYFEKLEKFRKGLLGIIHLTGGQPPRGTEIVNLRYQNTAIGGLRNVFLDSGSVMILTSYHKNLQQMNTSKYIYRYLPVDVGNLLVQYLWLVLPFVQFLYENGVVSPFLWAKTLSNSSSDFWPSESLRAILNGFFRKHLAVPMTIAAWRHISIAIARHEIRIDFGSCFDENEDDADDSDENIWDLQSGHSSNVALRIYARTKLQLPVGDVIQQEMFKKISLQWHTFLGFNVPNTNDTTTDVAPCHHQLFQIQRMKRLASMTVSKIVQHLRLMLRNNNAEFRGNQTEVIDAIFKGRSPIIQISGTGSGKSLSFMLPAFVNDTGTTIVIVPLIALESNLLQRCTNMGISAVIWKSNRSTPPVPIVLVTPESFMTKSFSDYLNHLLFRSYLDRIVFDECHMVLDSGDTFRPLIRQIATRITETNVQKVFLSATLPVSDMDRFFKAADIDKYKATVFRMATTRQNLVYSVSQVGPTTQDIAAAVKKAVTEHHGHRIVIYVRSLFLGQYLAKNLQVAFYHSNAGSNDEKNSIYENWIRNGGVLIATNALGMGVDVPDIRAVIHAGMPRLLRDFVQESGRAGRDGTVGYSIVLTNATFMLEDSTKQYIGMGCCRRCILDRFIDGNTTRQQCNEGEQRCDYCSIAHACLLENDLDFENVGAIRMDTALNELDIETIVEHKNVERRFQQERKRSLFSIESHEVDECKDMLLSFINSCVFCTLNKDNCEYPGFNDCPRQRRFYLQNKSFQQTMRSAIAIKKTLSQRKCMEAYSGCSLPGCYIPQAWCNSWESTENANQFRRATLNVCQYKNVVLDCTYICIYKSRECLNVFQQALREDNISLTNVEDIATWFGKKVRWGDVATNNLCKTFYHVLKEYKKEK